MLTVYTSTCCRPDLVQLLADCLRATFSGEYRFVVYVHRGGITRPWRNVDEVVQGTMDGYAAFQEISPAITGGRSLVIHDDCVPVMPWSLDLIPAGHIGRVDGSTLRFHDGPFHYPAPELVADRIAAASQCPPAWGGFCEQAVAAGAESMLDGLFCHLDKGTLWKPTAEQYDLADAIADHVGVPRVVPLTAEELAAHPGRSSPRPVYAPVAARKPTPGLGDMVAGALSAVGITKERVSAILGKDCGCPERQAAMNSWGKHIGIGIDTSQSTPDDIAHGPD
jgi:hypothetical protein